MSSSPAVIFLLAWAVPGLGHFLAGQTRKAVIFFVVLVGMFVIGLRFGGQLFNFDFGDPLVFLGSCAQWAVGAPRVFAALVGAGAGDLIAITYEYGNTFLIVAGLLNILVALDAFDRARGAQAR